MRGLSLLQGQGIGWGVGDSPLQLQTLTVFLMQISFCVVEGALRSPDPIDVHTFTVIFEKWDIDRQDLLNPNPTASPVI